MSLPRVRRNAVRPPRSWLPRSSLAVAVGVAMVLGVQQQGLTAAATTVGSDPDFTPRKDKPIKGRNAVPEPRPVDQADARVLRGTPQVRWPDTGVAEVAVPKPGGDNAWALALNGGRSADRAQAGDLPVWVAPTQAAAQERLRTGATTSLPAKVKVESLGRQGDALHLKVQRTDGVDRAGRIVLGVDYRAFRDTFGGDWGTRLRLVTEKGTVIPTRNNGSGDLAAEVPVTAQQQTFAVAAGPSSGAGDYKRGDLSGGAATWNIGGASGDFEWSLPLKVPPGIGGPQPTIGLQYSSGALDGLSSSSNNQSSVVGQGFSLNGGGSIERRYKSCTKDKAGGNNANRDTGDLCFAGDTLNVSVNGKSGTLVLDHRDATGEAWRMRGDDGSIIERFSGAANGDDGVLASDKGEYWRMTSRDGTKYYFGLNRLPGWVAGNAETRSAWTVPIFGNHAGEQCNRAAFADSWCQQAYQWNLDYVVDRHGNTMSLFYDTESGNYARNITETSVSPYIRAGNLKRIEYGQRDGQVFAQKPVAQVLYTPVERCTPTPCGPSEPAKYPDTPWDLNCASTTNCNNHYTPTFWTQKRLSKVTTQVWRANNNRHEDVQSWTLRHDYLRGDNSGAALWLAAISPAGHVGPALQMPEINFDGVVMANRVDTSSDMVPPLEWFRINAVHYGTGGDLSVNYEGIDCLPTSLPAADNNDRRCRPQKWTPEGAAERQDWYHKYVVKNVLETDRTVAANDPWQAPVPVTTTVQYLDKPAWRFEEMDAGTDLKDATWSQWRGYSKVRLTKGKEGETKSVNDTLYFRGMDGDRTLSGPPKDIKITDSTGVAVDDTNEFSGQARERIKYNGAAVEDKSITDYWLSNPTASMVRPWGTLEARRSGHKNLSQFQATDAGMLRTGTENTFDAAGRLLSKDEANDVSTTADDTCTRYQYVENPTKGLLELPAREQVVSSGCDETWTNADVVSDERLFYDNATSLTTPPTRGLVTKAERLSGFNPDNTPKYEPVFTATYDAFGRQTSLANGLQHAARKVFTPATYGPLTKVADVAPNGHETVTEYDPAWGLAVAVTRPDGLRAEVALDALGRTAKAWKPGHSSTADAADVEYSYLLRDNGASVVTTKRRIDADTVDLSYDLYDGLQRLRQTQEPTPAGGWLVTDYRYDSRGNKIKENGPYYTDAVAEQELKLVDELELPKQELTRWDTTEKPTAQVYKSLGEEKWEVTHDINATRQIIDPPTGQTPTMRILNPRGQLIELRQYTGDSPTGTYDKTTYSYWPGGQLKTVTDPANNVWRYDYDVQGRKIKETDPDKGISTYEYDSADQMTSSTDARGVKLAYGYDANGRKTAVHRDSLQGPKLTEWVYDTLSKGKPTSSTRFVAVDGRTDAYTTAITGYDTSGRPTGTTVTLPASEGRLAGSYAVSQTYTEDDQVKTRTLPAAGGLSQETLTYGYNDQGLPTTVSGQDTYVRSTEYNPFEQVHVLTRGTATGPWVQEEFEYDQATRRLNRVVVDKQNSPRRVSDTSYEYDPGGNVTKITDKPSATSGQPTDTQCFTYDYLRRLTAAWTPTPGADNEAGDCAATPTAASLGGPAPYWHKWTFDKTGNRKSEQRITAAGTTTSTYEYGSAKPHALTSVTTTGPAGTSTKTFGYDATGNTNSRTAGGVTEILNWDAEGHLNDATKGSAKSSFVYDADGNRLLRKDPSGTTLYFGETELHLGTDGSTLSGTRYYNFDKKVVGVRTNGKLSWLISDLHGTPTTAIDAANQSVQRRRTTPYGEARGAAPSSWPGQRDFHGGTSDPATGLVHLGAREYDPSTGRFISVDPVIDPKEPQQLNGYSYALNNPTSFDDSDGRLAIVLTVPVIVVILVVVVLIYAILVSFMQAITKSEVRAVEVGSVWDFFAWIWRKVVEFVTFVWTVLVEIWKLIEQIVTTIVAETHVVMQTVIRHVPDKKPTRNNQQNSGRGNGNNGNGNTSPANPPQPPKPQPPKPPKPPKPQTPKKAEGPKGNNGQQARGPKESSEPSTDLHRVSPTKRGPDELNNGLKPENFPRNAELDGAAHFGNEARVVDFARSHSGTHGQGFKVKVPDKWLRDNNIEVWEGMTAEQLEYVIPRELFREFNKFPRVPWAPK